MIRYEKMISTYLFILNMMNGKDGCVRSRGGTQVMRFYTIKLPKFLGGIVRAMLGTFKKN